MYYTFKKYYLVLLTCILLSSEYSFACVGARPFSMGGAFVGLADDINAVYWNPAGLAKISASFTFMHTVNNRDWINYNNFLAYVHPISKNSVIGISHIIVNQRKTPIFDNGKVFDWQRYNSKWYVISYGSSIGKRGWFKNLYWGFNVKQKTDKFYFEKNPENIYSK